MAVGLLASAAHLPSLGNGFAWDDVDHVVGNESLHDLGRLGEIVSSPYLRDTHPMRSPYRPVTSVSYAVSWAVGGGHPFPFHLFNVLAHVAAALLVLWLLVLTGAPAWAAGVGASVFAVHPVHVEAVANVVGRGDVLATLGVLAAGVLYLTRGLPRWARLAGIGSAAAVAVGAKETGIALPVLLVLLEWLRPGAGPERPSFSGRLRRDWAVWGVLGAVIAAYLWARWRVLGIVTTLDVAPYIAVLPEPVRVSTGVANLREVARLLLFPADLVADYGPDVITPAPPWSARFLVGAGVAVGALAVAALARRRAPRVTAGILWTGLALLPVSNLVVPAPIWLAERTLYLPSVGVALAAAGLAVVVARRGSRPARRAAVALLAVLVLLGSVRSWTRSATWRDTDTVALTLAAEHPESFRAQWTVGRRLLEAGDTARALVWYGRATETNPNDAFLRLDHARALLLAGRAREAQDLLRPIPPGLHPSRAVYLAQSLIQQGRKEEAREVVRDGLERYPDEARLRGQARSLGILPEPGGDGLPGGGGGPAAGLPSGRAGSSVGRATDF